MWRVFVYNPSIHIMAKKNKIKVKDVLEPGSNLKKRFIKDYDHLSEIVEDCRKAGYRIVLTQGVYDLIHEGHALYLEKARKHGDLLIVGVDSDELTRERKGPERPIVPEKERLEMLVHLRHVDIVTLRHKDDHIGKLIHTVKPDVLIISESTKDFTRKIAKEYEGVCGKIVCLPPQATTSTTARIRKLTIDGASQLAQEIHQLTDDFIQKIKDIK